MGRCLRCSHENKTGIVIFFGYFIIYWSERIARYRVKITSLRFFDIRTYLFLIKKLSTLPNGRVDNFVPAVDGVKYINQGNFRGFAGIRQLNIELHYLLVCMERQGLHYDVSPTPRVMKNKGCL